MDTLRITVAEENYDLYIIEGESLTDIVHQFRQLVGRSYIPVSYTHLDVYKRQYENLALVNESIHSALWYFECNENGEIVHVNWSLL